MAIDPSVVEKYRRVKALAERGEGGERDNARARKARFEAEHPGIAAAAALAEAREAVEAATRHAPPPQPPPPPRPAPGPSFWAGQPFTPRPGPARGSAPPPHAPPPRAPRPSARPAPEPATGSRLRDFFSSDFVRRAASVAGDVLGDLGAGLTLQQIADGAQLDVDENTRSITIKLRLPLESVRDARRLMGSTNELAHLLAARVRDELIQSMNEVDDDSD
jgi:hypothetical protein